MSLSSFKVDHVCETVDKPFEAFRSSLEDQLGHFYPTAYQLLEAGGDPQEARTQLEAMAGPSGFMIFRISDHGLALKIVGQSAKAIQYLLGNPLFAIEMTRYAIGAALYAPLRLLIHEPAAGRTTVEYDLPSSLFGQFGNADVNRTARMLDEKLNALISAASQ